MCVVFLYGAAARVWAPAFSPLLPTSLCIRVCHPIIPFLFTKRSSGTAGGGVSFFLFLIYIIGRHSITSASQPNGAHCDAKEYTSTFSWPSPMILHQNFVNYIFTVLDFYRHVILLHNNSPLQRRRRRENLYLLLLLLLFLCCVMTGFSLHLLLHEYYYIRFTFFVCNMPHDR